MIAKNWANTRNFNLEGIARLVFNNKVITRRGSRIENQLGTLAGWGDTGMIVNHGRIVLVHHQICHMVDDGIRLPP